MGGWFSWRARVRVRDANLFDKGLDTLITGVIVENLLDSDVSRGAHEGVALGLVLAVMTRNGYLGRFTRLSTGGSSVG